MSARDAHGSVEHDENQGEDVDGRDSLSADERGRRRAVDHPYRKAGREALLAQRRRKERELEQAEKAAERRERLKRELAFIDEELRLHGSQLLETIAPAGSCSARWEQMSGDDLARRCHRCHREVYDFAKMGDAEIERLLASLGPDSLQQLRRREDGRVVVGTCAQERPNGMLRGTRTVAAALLFGGAAVIGASLAEYGMPEPSLPEEPVEERAPPPPPAIASVNLESLRSNRVDRMPEDPTEPSAPPRPLEERIRWLAPEVWEVDRTLGADILSGAIPAGHLVPDDDGGLRVLGVRRGEAFARLGLRNGDRITEVNGIPLEGTADVLRTFTQLKDSDALFVKLVRRRETRLHVYRLRPE